MKRFTLQTIFIGLLLSGLALTTNGQSLPAKPLIKPVSMADDKSLPKEVSLTEVQRLKLENAQLKLRELDRQIKELQKQISDELTGVMKLAGVPETEFGNYGFDDKGRLVYVEPRQTQLPAKK